MKEHYMQMALELAEKARGRTSPNPMVGAVVVLNGQVVGTGYHKRAGLPHAEVNALNDAGDAARGADLYINLEPCSHYGRTPPCTEAIIRAGIKRVYIALSDPNPLVSGKGVQMLTENGIEVSIGILENQARKLNEVFLKYIRTCQPFVSLKAATTLDGKIATEKGESQWITGEEARLHGHKLRDAYDAILVGIGTVLADNPSLNCRLPGGKGQDPVRIIVDSKLSISEDARVINFNSPARTIIAVTSRAAPEKIRRFERKAEIVMVNEGSTVLLPALLKILGQMGITSVLVEGGGQINGSFLRENLIDKYYFYLAPRIVGGENAPGAFMGKGIPNLPDARELSDMEIVKLGKDILITGYPEKEGINYCLQESSKKPEL